MLEEPSFDVLAEIHMLDDKLHCAVLILAGSYLRETYLLGRIIEQTVWEALVSIQRLQNVHRHASRVRGVVCTTIDHTLFSRNLGFGLRAPNARNKVRLGQAL
jgi:hypothetical protein